MGISSALNAGVMGLAVNAVKLSTISDNIANSQTYGYKRADTEFADMVLAQTNGDYNAGGVRVSEGVAQRPSHQKRKLRRAERALRRQNFG